jgi:hypothetical protein
VNDGGDVGEQAQPALDGRPRSDRVGERGSGDDLHDIERLSARPRTSLQQAHDRGVLQLGRDPDLPLEPSAKLVRRGEQLFDGDRSIQAAIAGHQNSAHSTSRELVTDGVSARIDRTEQREIDATWAAASVSVVEGRVEPDGGDLCVAGNRSIDSRRRCAAERERGDDPPALAAGVDVRLHGGVVTGGKTVLDEHRQPCLVDVRGHGRRLHGGQASCNAKLPRPLQTHRSSVANRNEANTALGRAWASAVTKPCTRSATREHVVQLAS